MRIAFAAALICAALPTVAAARAPVRVTPEQAASALQNPLVQEAGARSLMQLVGIVLDTRIGAAGALAGPDAGIAPNATLRDLARRDDPQFEDHLYHRTERALSTAGAVAGGAAAQAKELKRTAARLDAALAPLLGALGGGD